MRSGFHFPMISSNVATDHVFALESFSQINKYFKTEILVFCYCHSVLLLLLIDVTIMRINPSSFKRLISIIKTPRLATLKLNRLPGHLLGHLRYGR